MSGLLAMAVPSVGAMFQVVQYFGDVALSKSEGTSFFFFLWSVEIQAAAGKREAGCRVEIGTAACEIKRTGDGKRGVADGFGFQPTGRKSPEEFVGVGSADSGG